MPDGKKHLQLIWIGSVAYVPVTALLARSPEAAVAGLAGYYIGGLFLDPDLDMLWRTSAEIRMFKLNKALGRLYTYYWMPYSQMTHHYDRLALDHSGVSHKYILGILSRLAWILVTLLPVVAVLDLIVGVTSQDLWIIYNFCTQYWYLLTWALFGWFVADTIHIWADRREDAKNRKKRDEDKRNSRQVGYRQ